VTWSGRTRSGANKQDLRRSFPGGPDTYYWFTRCGKVVATIPNTESRHCECGNVFLDVGRCVIKDFDEVVVLAVFTRTGEPS
jgi:hypothetical protein